MPTKLFLAVIFSLFTIDSEAQQVRKSMLRLPDTGQTNSFTTTFGEDHDYLINAPVFIDNGDGTVTDTVTGLMWQSLDGGEMTHAAAGDYCDTMTLAGYTDWRLPDCHELFSILNHGRPNPAIDTLYFIRTTAEYWWSSQLQFNDSNKVWVTNSGGGVGNHLKTETLSAGGTKRFHVRAVRDVYPPVYLQQRFLNNGDGTVTDQFTDLMWQQPYGDSITWEQALLMADSSSFAGFSDWRLPNIKELQSINDETRANPSVDLAFFSGVTVAKYWSSTSLNNQAAKAWYLDTRFGITTYQFKTNRLVPMLVRGGDVLTRVPSYDFSNKDIVVFPVPAARRFTVRHIDTMNRLLVMDMIGNEVFSARPEAATAVVDLTTAGVYLLIITSGDHTTVKKIVVSDN